MKRLSAEVVDPTGYLQEKKLSFELLSSLIGLSIFNDHWYGNCIQYPLINVHGQIIGFERIFPRGVLHKHCPDRFSETDNKKVTKGTKVSESFALIGISLAQLPNYFGCLRIVGGMTDAVNVHLATGEPVVSIVGENNARSIVRQLSDQWPHLQKHIVVALDHDLPGISACHRSGQHWAVPQRYGDDWSDVRQDQGLQGLKQQLQQIKTPLKTVDINAIPQPAIQTAIDAFTNDFNKSLKYLTRSNNEQSAAAIAKAIITRFHSRVPAKTSERDFLRRMQAANPYWLHPDTLGQLAKTLAGYCCQEKQTIQKCSGLSTEKKKKLKSAYHQIDAINPQTVPLKKGCITLIKAPYASGKTKLLTALSMAASQAGDRILAITHRVSLAHELSNRLGLDSYLDIPEPFMSSVQRLVTCINSLCAPGVDRFIKTGKLDVLLLDEFSQHIGVLGVGAHIKDPSVLSRYLDLIEQTPTVVISDADLSSYHVSLLQEKFPEKEIQFYEMPFSANTSLSCSFGAGQACSKSVIDHQLLPSIARGEKVVIATDSRKAALKLESTIRKQFPDASMLMIDGKNRGEAAQKAFLQNGNEQAEKYQIILYTPVLESGVSITAPFDHMFGFSHNVVLPTDFVQMLRRFRSVEHFSVVADLLPRGSGNQDWLARVQALKHTDRYRTNVDDVCLSEYDGFCECEKARQIKMKSLGGNGLFYLLQSRGFAMDYINLKPHGEEFEALWHEAQKHTESESRSLLKQAPILTAEQNEEICHKAEPTFQELCSSERFRLCDELGIEHQQLTDADIEFWQTIGITRLRRFMQFPKLGGGQYEPQPDPEGMPLCHRRFEDIGLKVYRAILEPLFPNWDYTKEWGIEEAEKVVDRVAAFHKDAPFMLNQLKLIPDSVIRNTAKGAEFKRPASACQFVSQLLKMAGLKTTNRQCRAGGGRVRFYRIEPESLAVMVRYSESRARHNGIRVSQAGKVYLQNANPVTRPLEVGSLTESSPGNATEINNEENIIASGSISSKVCRDLVSAERHEGGVQAMDAKQKPRILPESKPGKATT